MTRPTRGCRKGAALRSFRPVARVVLAVALFAALSAPAMLAGSDDFVPGQHSDVSELSLVELFEKVAEVYAQDAMVTTDEAKRRLLLQNEMLDFATVIEEEVPEAFTTWHIYQEPNFRVVIFVVPGGEEQIAPYIPNSPLADAIQFELVEYTRVELHSDFVTADEMLRSIGINASGEVEANHSIFWVEDVEAVARLLGDAGLVLPSSVRLIELDVISVDDATVMGGFRATFPSGHGACTTGFSGYQLVSGVHHKGFFSAAHCNHLTTGPTVLAHIADVQFSLRSQYLGGNDDFEFYNHRSEHTLRSMVNIGTNWVRLTGTRGHGIMKRGVMVCVYGQATNYFDCGWIWSSTHRSAPPEWAPHITFNASFIRVKNKPPDQANPNGPETTGRRLTKGGDSGGPWIGGISPNANAAFGFHKGRLTVQDNDIGDPIFMAQSFSAVRGFHIYINCQTVGGIDHNCN